MAEIIIAVGNYRKRGVQRLKKHNLKTDMTPMVDLGFLLITFFVFTTEITKPMTMNLYMPHDGRGTLVPESHSVTFLVNGDKVLYYYFGTEETAIENNRIYPVTFDETSGIGKIIRQKQSELQQSGTNKNKLVVLIKPGDNASYKNVLDLLDEMTIDGVTRYALVKLDNPEKQFFETSK